MNIDLTRAQASAISKVLHEYLCEGGAIPGVDNDDVAEAFRTLDIAAHYTASVKLKPSPMAEAAPDLLEALGEFLELSELAGDDDHPAYAPTMAKARNAIAKATA